VTPSLVDPLHVGSLHVRNRVVMAPMGLGLSNVKGEVNRRITKHYMDRCQDVGLLMVEATGISLGSRVSKRQLSITRDNIPGFKELVKDLHVCGSVVALQLFHAGGAAPVEPDCQPLAPSSVLVPEPYTVVPREMDRDDINEVVEAFIQAAGRAQEAEFDAVELHGAHGYLLNQFLSPLTNRRLDEYGGSLENRVRISSRIVEGIKQDLGSDYPVLYRLGAEDILPGGLSLSEGMEAARLLVSYGVDIIDVSIGVGSSLNWLDQKSSPGFLVPLAAAVKKAVDVPVVGVGGIKTPEVAESFIRSGSVDLIAVGRAILKDPQWVTKTINSFRCKSE